MATKFQKEHRKSVSTSSVKMSIYLLLRLKIKDKDYDNNVNSYLKDFKSEERSKSDTIK